VRLSTACHPRVKIRNASTIQVVALSSVTRYLVRRSVPSVRKPGLSEPNYVELHPGSRLVVGMR
jgi:hypothetical protein